MIRVPIKSWYESEYGRSHEYAQFHNGFEEIPMPTNSPYHAGDVVIINNSSEPPCIGVVLGIIDCDRGELRTDACGMVSFSDIRHVKTLKELKSYPNTEYIINSLDTLKANTQKRAVNLRKAMKRVTD